MVDLFQTVVCVQASLSWLSPVFWIRFSASKYRGVWFMAQWFNSWWDCFSEQPLLSIYSQFIERRPCSKKGNQKTRPVPQLAGFCIFSRLKVTATDNTWTHRRWLTCVQQSPLLFLRRFYRCLLCFYPWHRFKKVDKSSVWDANLDVNVFVVALPCFWCKSSNTSFLVSNAKEHWSTNHSSRSNSPKWNQLLYGRCDKCFKAFHIPLAIIRWRWPLSRPVLADSRGIDSLLCVPKSGTHVFHTETLLWHSWPENPFVCRARGYPECFGAWSAGGNSNARVPSSATSCICFSPILSLRIKHAGLTRIWVSGSFPSCRV